MNKWLQRIYSIYVILYYYYTVIMYGFIGVLKCDILYVLFFIDT